MAGMSRRSRYLTSRLRRMEDVADSATESMRGVLTSIENMLTEDRNEWEHYLPAARSTMTFLNEVEYFSLPDRLAEQRWIVQVLQDYAYHDSDDGSIQDIANWCQASWLRILRDHPDDVESLTGLGHNWLQRTQATLAKIHREEGSGSSTGSSNPGTAAQRAQTPLFVEARGYLQPAVDFFCRAVSAAEQNNSLSGKLFASAAEAYMSLGNVSSPLVAEQHFVQAIRYLRRAQAMPGFTLSVYLQEYLENYGRYVT